MALDFSFLKPGDNEVIALAQREASVEHEPEFRPICLGPVGNFIVLALTGVAAAPFILWRILRHVLGRK